VFPQTRCQKVTDPDLQCTECDGYGEIHEKVKLGTFTGIRESWRGCEVCNGTGEDPSKKPTVVKLTPREIEHILRAVTVVKAQLSETSEGDESREVFQRLIAKFTDLTK
jgi:hypothetical protein